ncbi:MAG: hypothetical protein AAF039_17980 [Bacteroidota bacterium]
MKKTIYALLILFVFSCSDSDDPSETIDSGRFEIEITQTGDFGQYLSSITATMTGTQINNCDDENVPNLIVYDISEFANCTISGVGSATQLTGTLIVGEPEPGLINVGDMTLSVVIRLDGETVQSESFSQTATSDNVSYNFDIDPADFVN